MDRKVSRFLGVNLDEGIRNIYTSGMSCADSQGIGADCERAVRVVRIEIDAIVKTKEGKHVGKVYRVVIDPNQNKVTHLAVETGFLLRRLVIIPIAAVKGANHHIRLTLNAKELDEMPDYVETEYAAPPQGRVPPFSYPSGGVLWPGGYIDAPIVVEQEKRVPQDSLEVNHGTEVFALDGRIGTVGQVVLASKNNKVVGYIVAKGEDLPCDVFIPTDWIAAAGGGRLSLSRTRADAMAQGSRATKS